MNKQIESIPTEVMEALVGHSWPGNIRELQNFIERSVILTSGNALRPPLEELKRVAEPESFAAITLHDAERDHILKTLRQTRWVVAGPNEMDFEGRGCCDLYGYITGSVKPQGTNR
jgi:formate hydrogenlyase transcriptional activator